MLKQTFKVEGFKYLYEDKWNFLYLFERKGK